MHTFLLETLEPIVALQPMPLSLKSNPFPSARNVLLHSQLDSITKNYANISPVPKNTPLLELDYMRSVTRVNEEKRQLAELQKREMSQDERLDAPSPTSSTCSTVSSSSVETEHSDSISQSKKKRKNKKLSNGINGIWMQEEHMQFLKGYASHGRNWKVIADKYVRTRNRSQVASHAQKFIQKQRRVKGLKDSPDLLQSILLKTRSMFLGSLEAV